VSGVAAIGLGGGQTGGIVVVTPPPRVRLSPGVASGRYAFLTNGDVWTITSDGTTSRLHRLTHDGGLTSFGGWFPDGSLLAARPGPSGARELVRIRGPVFRTERVVARDVAGVSFALSPDGTRVASCSRNATLVIRDLASGSERDVRLFHGIPAGVDVWCRDPSWSPDGSRIAVARYGGPSKLPARGDLLIVRADGGGERTIAAGFLSGVSWSPEGTGIAVVTHPSGWERGPSVLAVVDPTSGGVRSIAPGASLPLHPAWSSSGHFVVFVWSGRLTQAWA